MPQYEIKMTWGAHVLRSQARMPQHGSEVRCMQGATCSVLWCAAAQHPREARAWMRASLLERAVRTMARPSSSRICLPAMGSRKLSILLSACPPFPPPFLAPFAFLFAPSAILLGRHTPLSQMVNTRLAHALQDVLA